MLPPDRIRSKRPHRRRTIPIASDNPATTTASPTHRVADGHSLATGMPARMASAGTIAANTAERAAPLLAQHPALSVDLVLADSATDLVKDGLDATIRIGVVTDPELVVRRIGQTRRVVVATPDYIARAGMPGRPEDLAGHECMLFTGLATGAVWPFTEPAGPVAVPVSGRFRANSSEAIREAVLAGIGIVLAPLWLFGPVLREGRVTVLLAGWTPTALPIQAVFPSRRQVPARVRAVVDHLAAEFRLDPALTDYGAG